MLFSESFYEAFEENFIRELVDMYIAKINVIFLQNLCNASLPTRDLFFELPRFIVSLKFNFEWKYEIRNV